MRKILAGLICLSISLLYSCEKNNCQTSLAGSWVIRQHPPYLNGTVIDSIRFFKADSVYTRYRLNDADTISHFAYNSYFITENCQEVDFVANISLGGDSARKFDILIIDANRFDLRSKAKVGCDSCIISLRK